MGERRGWGAVAALQEVKDLNEEGVFAPVQRNAIAQVERFIFPYAVELCLAKFAYCPTDSLHGESAKDCPPCNYVMFNMWSQWCNKINRLPEENDIKRE